LKHNIIDDTDITEIRSNGGRVKTTLFEIKGILFRIDIKSESHDFQSYARLEILGSDNKWEVLKRMNPKKDFNIDISYQTSPSQKAFDPILSKLIDLAKKLVPMCTKGGKQYE